MYGTSLPQLHLKLSTDPPLFHFLQVHIYAGATQLVGSHQRQRTGRLDIGSCRLS
jgi:hypothetical protein